MEGKSQRGKLFFDKKYTTRITTIICLTFASDKGGDTYYVIFSLI
jgi:hypothetical protein